MAEAAASGTGAAGLAPGKQITKGVSLLKPLSAGGMGAVWLADHLSLKTQVVVKFMLGGLDSSDSARTRFSREAAAAAQVKSPHVVQMLDHGVTDDGVPFIVMEHLEGHDLGDEIEKHGALDFAKVVTVVGQVAKALSKVHAAGLLHRDIKPDNIFLVDGEEDVFVKLLDFGIAKSSVTTDDGSLDGETKTGQVVGTPFYMSPEQVTAQKNIDHRSDLWALGIVAYEALTGERPYDGPSFGALAVKIATGTPRRPTEANPALPPSIDAWFAKACAREPIGRFGSAKEMADAFRAAFEGVVSLPAGVVSSDSGQRARSGSMPDQDTGPNTKKSRSGSGSGPREGVATLGLAKTALDDSDSDAAKRHVALGRSEAGMSSVVEEEAQPRGARLLYVGGAVVLSIVVAIVIVTTFRPGSTATIAASGGSSTKTTASTPSAPSTSSTSSTSASEAPSALASTSAAAVAPAPSAPPSTARSVTPPTKIPATPPTKTAPTTVKTTEPTPTKTAPTTKPTDTAPDLF